MSFRLVPKSVNLNDIEWCNGRYFALFQRIRVAYGRIAQKFTLAISSPDEFLLLKVNFSAMSSVTFFFEHSVHISITNRSYERQQ